MANYHMNKCPILLVIKEMKIYKTTMSYLYIPADEQKIKSLTTPGLAKM